MRGIEPWSYLSWLLARLPGAPVSGSKMLTPYSLKSPLRARATAATART